MRFFSFFETSKKKNTERTTLFYIIYIYKAIVYYSHGSRIIGTLPVCGHQIHVHGNDSSLRSTDPRVLPKEYTHKKAHEDIKMVIKTASM